MSMLKNAKDKFVVLVSNLSPLIIVVILICAGVSFVIAGFLIEVLVNDTSSVLFKTGDLIKTLGLTILVGGVIGAIMRVVAMLNLHEEMFKAFIMDDETLKRRNDLEAIWLRLTRVYYLRGHGGGDDELASEVDECLKGSLLTDHGILLEDVNRNIVFDWKRDDNCNVIDGEMAFVREKLEMTVVPIGEDGTGQYNTEYSVTADADFSAYKFNVRLFKSESWDGEDVNYEIIDSKDKRILRANFKEKKEYL